MTIRKAIAVITLILMGIAFNNFSRTETKISEERAKHFATDLKTKLAGLKPPTKDFCENSQNYSCLQKIFRPTQASSTQHAQLPCVKLLQGGELCPSGTTHTYKTEAAIKACPAPCDQNYDYEEYSCHLKLQAQGSELFPLIETGADLNTVIEKLHEACVQIQAAKDAQ